jgi:hypothetical protein
MVVGKVGTLEGEIQVELKKPVFELVMFTRIVVGGSDLHAMESSFVVAASGATGSSTGC